MTYSVSTDTNMNTASKMDMWLVKPMFEKLMQKADIKINGTRPWDIQVHDESLYRNVLFHGSLGLGEAYVAGKWDAEELDQFFFKILRAKLDDSIVVFSAVQAIRNRLINTQTIRRSSVVGKKHYDISNKLYQAMLDKNMVYTCGHWEGAKDLDEAQENKLDMVCKKMGLRPGMSVLDIGCGWGSFLYYAAKNYGVKVVGVTISKEQAEFARAKCEGLPAQVLLRDYREIEGEFDRIVSLGMFEHVGYKNYKTFMKTASKLLKDDGLFLLHTIGHNISTKETDPWIEKYIFPNSMLPSMKQISSALENIFVVEDWHNFGVDYDKTLLAWYDNFARNWKHLKEDFDDDFYRLWKYYLLSCAGCFRARSNNLWQIVLSKKGILGGYHSFRSFE